LIQEHQLEGVDGKRQLLTQIPPPHQQHPLSLLLPSTPAPAMCGTMIKEEHPQVVQVVQKMLMEALVDIICILRGQVQTIVVVIDIIGLE